MHIIFIVNGENVPVEADINSPLAEARNKALAASYNTGRPPDEWGIRDERGVLLSPDAKVESYGFKEAVRLFLTLGTGAGGYTQIDSAGGL